MHIRKKAVPLGLAAAALLAPSAQAAEQVVANPAPGVTALSISDSAEAGKVVIRATTPVASDHFSALLLDVDGDGAGDRAVVATGSSIAVRSTTGSTSSCQQLSGSTASPVPGATALFNQDGSGWVVTVPAAALPGSFAWKVTATAPGSDDLCGGTDGAVEGLALSFFGARTFVAEATAPADSTPPAAPQGLSASAGDRSVSLDWADGSESDLAAYLVYRRAVGGTFTLVGESTASDFDDAAVVNDKRYEYYVKAMDTSGNLSQESGRVTATPARPGDRPAPVVKPLSAIPIEEWYFGYLFAYKHLHFQALTVLSDVGIATLAEPSSPAGAKQPVPIALFSNVGATATTVVSKVTGRSKARKGRAGKRRLTLAPGESQLLKVKLGKRDRKLLRKRGAVDLTVKVAVRPEGGTPEKGVVSTRIERAEKKASK